jgi:hypothetical protein
MYPTSTSGGSRLLGTLSLGSNTWQSRFQMNQPIRAKFWLCLMNMGRPLLWLRPAVAILDL